MQELSPEDFSPNEDPESGDVDAADDAEESEIEEWYIREKKMVSGRNPPASESALTFCAHCAYQR